MALGALSLTSCDDLFEPAIENFKDVNQMEAEPDFAQGFLTKAYSGLSGYYNNSEYATDDAVVNANSDAFRTMATGGWTSRLWTSINEWNRSFSGIQYLNQFLAKVDKVNWASDEARAKLLATRMKGEAYGLRAILHYQLLRAHAGYSIDGELLGIPYLTHYLSANDDLNLPRLSFKACVDSIYKDMDAATKLLPLDYEDMSEVPAKYRVITEDVGVYNRAMGKNFRLLVSGRIVEAYRSRLALLAASPAYIEAQAGTWVDAAKYAAAVINDHGGLSSLAPDGVEYYAAAIADNLKEGANPQEILWRENIQSSSNSQEIDNFPPSLNGNGRMNPSQNLVDAFPMANGYPITNAASKYDAAHPYAGRDPRLSKYIIYNGSREGVNNDVISTVAGTTDGIDKVEQRSTRTGYYMKKRLRMDVNTTAGSVTQKPHYNPRIRYTEIFLNYAEAANEAWGPKADGGNGYSAYDVIKAIRKRAGVGGDSDPYLEQCATSQEKMRELIYNERRLELCFESFRFWDLRRWKKNLNETVKGINWKADGTYELIDVEERKYDDYMYYAPIPNSEILKYSNLKQNKGWK
jgi:hypothetical protein